MNFDAQKFFADRMDVYFKNSKIIAILKGSSEEIARG